MSDWVPLDEGELLQANDSSSRYMRQNLSQGQQFHSDGLDPEVSPSQRAAPGASSSSPPSGTSTQPRGREITKEMILRALERQGTKKRPPPGDLEDKFLSAQSHLRLNGMGIARIANLRQLTTLEVLYLYDNQIEAIANVSHLKRLTHLYLSNNQLTAISGLAGMPCLQKLYLEHNAIQVVSGLEQCPSLEELHVSGQRLPPAGPGLRLEPATAAALGRSLRVLAASRCGLGAEEVGDLAGLRRLVRLDLSHNGLEGFDALDGVVGGMGGLQSLDLRGNPLCRQPKYRDTAILLNDAIATLDDEPVPPQQREFLLRLHIRRMKAALAAEAKEGAGGGGGAGRGDAAAAQHAQQGHPAPGHVQHGHAQYVPQGPSGYGPQGHGIGAASGAGPHGAGGSGRTPPRTGGFNAAAAGAGGAGGGGGGARGVSRNSSGSAAGSVGALALGMEGVALSR